MKKGQLLSQPFVIIFALIVMALIIFFGYKAITGLMSTGEKVCHVKFKQSLQNEVNDLNTQPIGSNTQINIPTCGGIKAVCALDVKNSETGKIPYKDVKELANLLSETGSQDNIFFSSANAKTRFEPLHITKLKATTFVCDGTNDGKFQALLENKGTFIEITK